MHFNHSSLISRKKTETSFSHRINKHGVLDRLADDLERVGARMHVDCVHPLLRLHCFVSCTNNQANQKLRPAADI